MIDATEKAEIAMLRAVKATPAACTNRKAPANDRLAKSHMLRLRRPRPSP